jgi:hypothetical protein
MKLMLRSIARYGSAMIALGVLSLSISQTGCGNKTKEPDSALPGTKLGPVIPKSQPESSQAASEPAPTIDSTFFPGTKAGPMLPKSTPTSQKKAPTKNSNEPVVLPPSKSGKFFAPPSQNKNPAPVALPPSKSGDFLPK